VEDGLSWGDTGGLGGGAKENIGLLTALFHKFNTAGASEMLDLPTDQSQDLPFVNSWYCPLVATSVDCDGSALTLLIIQYPAT
jgi:hypothetical protein